MKATDRRQVLVVTPFDCQPPELGLSLQGREEPLGGPSHELQVAHRAWAGREEVRPVGDHSPCLGRSVICAELGAGDLDDLLAGVVGHLSQDRHVFAAHGRERIIHRPQRSAAEPDDGPFQQ